MVTFWAVSGPKLGGGWSISETKHKKFLPLLPFVIIYDGYHMLKKFWKSADPHLLVLPGFLGQGLLKALLQRICGEKVYKQLAEEIIHPKTGQTSVLRRASTGNSTACSSYPIPEAPEHINQLGDMKVIFEKPLWSVEETDKIRLEVHAHNTF